MYDEIHATYWHNEILQGFRHIKVIFSLWGIGDNPSPSSMKITTNLFQFGTLIWKRLLDLTSLWILTGFILEQRELPLQVCLSVQWSLFSLLIINIYRVIENSMILEKPGASEKCPWLTLWHQRKGPRRNAHLDMLPMKKEYYSTQNKFIEGLTTCLFLYFATPWQPLGAKNTGKVGKLFDEESGNQSPGMGYNILPRRVWPETSSSSSQRSADGCEEPYTCIQGQRVLGQDIQGLEVWAHQGKIAREWVQNNSERGLSP